VAGYGPLFLGSRLCALPKHRVTVGSIRVREQSDLLRCAQLRGIGFSWRCSCGLRGPVFARYRDALMASRRHAEGESAVLGE
jgi:hypothetical protein